MGEALSIVGIKLEVSQLKRGVSQSEREIRKLNKQVRTLGKEAKTTTKSAGNLGRTLAKLTGGLISFYAATRATREIISVNRTFQRLDAQLKTVTGTITGAEVAFNMIKEFTATTPFQLENVTSAFVQLTALGMKPTVEQMRGLGNMAAAFTRDITDLTGAVVSGANGMTRPLRAYGIIAATSGDKVKVTFRGVTHEVDRTVESMTKLVSSFGNVQFGDAMSVQMETLNGIISNLGDNATLLAGKIGEAGLNAELAELLKFVRDTVAEGDEFGRVLGRTMGGSVEILTAILKALVHHADTVVWALQAITSVAIIRGFYALGTALTAAAVQAGGLRTVLAGIAFGPMGAVVAIAAAIGGPLVFSLLTAKTEAEGFGDALEAAKRAAGTIAIGDIPAMIESKTKALETLTLRLATMGRPVAISARDAIKSVHPGIPDVPEDRAPTMAQTAHQVEVLEGELAVLNMRMFEYNELQARAAEERRGEDFTELIQALQDERLELERGARALLVQQMIRKGFTETMREEALTEYDLNQAARADQKAREDATQAVLEAETAVKALIDGLEDEVRTLTMSSEELVIYELRQSDATEADIRRAVGLNRLAEAERRRVREAEDANRDLERQNREYLASMEAEFNQLKSSADRMAEDFVAAMLKMSKSIHNIDDAFWELVNNMINEIARLTARMAITEPIANWVAGIFSKGGKPTPAAATSSGGGLLPGIGAAPYLGLGGGAPAGPGGVAPAIMPSGPGGSSGGSLVVHQVINIPVNAIDGKDAADFLRSQKGEIMSIVGEGVRQSRAFQTELMR